MREDPILFLTCVDMQHVQCTVTCKCVRDGGTGSGRRKQSLARGQSQAAWRCFTPCRTSAAASSLPARKRWKAERGEGGVGRRQAGAWTGGDGGGAQLHSSPSGSILHPGQSPHQRDRHRRKFGSILQSEGQSCGGGG